MNWITLLGLLPAVYSTTPSTETHVHRYIYMGSPLLDDLVFDENVFAQAHFMPAITIRNDDTRIIELVRSINQNGKLINQRFELSEDGVYWTETPKQFGAIIRYMDNSIEEFNSVKTWITENGKDFQNIVLFPIESEEADEESKNAIIIEEDALIDNNSHNEYRLMRVKTSHLVNALSILGDHVPPHATIASTETATAN